MTPSLIMRGYTQRYYNMFNNSRESKEKIRIMDGIHRNVLARRPDTISRRTSWRGEFGGTPSLIRA